MDISSDEWRERLIKRAIAKTTPHGIGVGIFGAEICQLCGRLGTFNGWVSAMSMHSGGYFFHWDCLKPIDPRPTPDGLSCSAAAAAQQIVDARDYRFCNICAERIAASTVGLCGSCRGLIGDRNPGPILGEFNRQRYVALTCTTDEALRAFDITLEAKRLDLEEMLDPSLAPQRTTRAQQALRDAGEAHGVEYLHGGEGI